MLDRCYIILQNLTTVLTENISFKRLWIKMGRSTLWSTSHYTISFFISRPVLSALIICSYRSIGCSESLQFSQMILLCIERLLFFIISLKILSSYLRKKQNSVLRRTGLKTIFCRFYYILVLCLLGALHQGQDGSRCFYYSLSLMDARGSSDIERENGNFKLQPDGFTIHEMKSLKALHTYGWWHMVGSNMDIFLVHFNKWLGLSIFTPTKVKTKALLEV